MQNLNIKRILIFLFAAIVCCPPVYQHFHKTSHMPLDGAFTPPEKPVLSKESWFSGKYQEEYQKYKEFNLSLRPVFIRMRNQIHYTLWNGINVNDQINGKDNYLFSINEIKRELGMQTLSHDEIDKRVSGIKKMQQKLSSMGVKLLVVIPPSKQYFLKDKFPSPYSSVQKKENDYDIFRKKFSEYSIPVFDITPYFESLRGKTKYPLYTREGFHWSSYAAELATDTMMHYVEQYLGVKMPKRKWIKVNETHEPGYPDNDIGIAMNLLKNIKEPLLGYPEIVTDTTGEKPRVIVMGDSYFNNWFDAGIFGKIFSNESSFWYYNMTDRSKARPDRNMSEVNRGEEIKKSRLVILFINNTNFGGFPFGIENDVINLK